MIIGTAGHIDHGKTSLVRALTGVDTDRLPEEKARGITLDLGFAYVPLPGGGVLGFVDVPGHERLVHTMIAGAASIGMALLVVAADDGVMPQTREHLQILSLLGLTRGIVALTKSDLASPDRLEEVELEIMTLLEGTSLADAEIIPVSTITGMGVETLRTRLMEAAASDAAASASGRAFRLAVDRSFSLAGAGTVVTGSVVAGSVAVGDSLLILPSGLKARVRGIHAANQTADRAITGERCALNLTGPAVHKDAISRGDWVMDPAQGATTSRADIVLRLLPSERGALRSGAAVLLHHGADHVSARVVMLEPTLLPPGAEGLAQLILHRPLPLRHGDRLVLRDATASRTMAGGTVLDPGAPVRQRRGPARIEMLRILSGGDDAAALAGVLALPPFLLRRQAVLDDWGLTEAGLVSLRPDLLNIGGFIAIQAGMAALTQAVESALDAFHDRSPAIPGMTAEALRLALPWRLPREAFAALLASLLTSGTVAAEAHLLRAPGHRGGLAGEEARVWALLRPLLEDAWFRPPLLRELGLTVGVGEVPLRRLCKGFARLGLVTEVAPDRFFLRDAVAGMVAAAAEVSAAVDGGWFTAAQFRDRTGNGRQLAIQVLDYFDRRGITVRKGDLRRSHH